MPVGDVFVWQVRSFTVRLSLPIIDRLRAALLRLPANEEHGGILLGQIVSPNTVEVTSCEFFPSAHRKGTLYDLGARERERVAMRARELARVKAERPVGYFRTHQRPGLFLDQDDFALMEEAFREPGSVALLLRPRNDGPPDAGFFFWELGDLDRKQTHLLFPFDSEMLRMQGRVESPTPASAAAPVNRAAFSFSLPALAKRYQPALLWAGGAVLSFAGVAAFLGSRPVMHRTPSNPFDLRIARSGQSLLVDWNRNAPALRDAPSATLTINDGDSQQRVTLDHAELAHGSVQFWPQSEHVVVRMDVNNSREISESVTAVVEGDRMKRTEAANTPAPSTLPPPENVATARPDEGPRPRRLDEDDDDTSAATYKPRPFRELARPSRPPVRAMDSSAPQQPVNSPPPATVANRPSPTPPAETTATPPANPAAAPVAKTTPEHTVTVSVKLEPRPPSEMHKVIGHIPLFGHIGSLRYRGSEDDFHAPRPARSLEPKVPGYMLDSLKRPIDIDVLVSIDKSGHVKDTEVLEGAGTGFGSLAADRAASIQWDPARVGDKPVASQVVAHYHFRRVEREVADAQPEPHQ
jgi:hypothetical protein